MNLPAEMVVVSELSVGRSHGVGVVNGVRGKLSNGASGCLMSYKNSGIIGTVNNNNNNNNNKYAQLSTFNLNAKSTNEMQCD